MALNNIDLDLLLIKGSGFLGAFFSLRRMGGTPAQKLMLFLGGGTGSYYAAPYVSHLLGLPEGLSGFLIGMFGMSIIEKVLEAIEQTSLTERWGRLLDRLVGGAK